MTITTLDKELVRPHQQIWRQASLPQRMVQMPWSYRKSQLVWLQTTGPRDILLSIPPFLSCFRQHDVMGNRLLYIWSMHRMCDVHHNSYTYEENLKSVFLSFSVSLTLPLLLSPSTSLSQDPQYMQQALTNALLMDAVVGCLQSQKAIFAATKLAHFDRMKLEGMPKLIF